MEFKELPIWWQILVDKILGVRNSVGLVIIEYNYANANGYICGLWALDELDFMQQERFREICFNAYLVRSKELAHEAN